MTATPPAPEPESSTTGSAQIFAIFLRLGLTSFGGPVAHIGFFRDEFVNRRRWLDDRAYADLVALCQFLPGPASSQVGLAIGLIRHGYAGALSAWLGFTLPSAIVMAVCGLGMLGYGNVIPPELLHGLKIAALAVVANALYGMARTLCPGPRHAGFALLAAIAMLVGDQSWLQVGVIALAAIAGRLLLIVDDTTPDTVSLPLSIGKGAAIAAAALFGILLVVLPLLVWALPDAAMLAIADVFYRVGSLVFGGGHVVLPLLQAELVPTGWIDDSAFIAGYGVAQTVPGPLFTFAAYLGAVVAPHGVAGGVVGATVAVLAVFQPSLLLVVAALPFRA
ncbi:MAG: chromate efflux transporter, partial [Alphaproteobacteria bacterium]